MRIALMSVVLVLGSNATVANAQEASSQQDRSPWVYSVKGGAIQQSDTDIDAGGSFSVSRGYVEPGVTYVLGPQGSVGLSLGFGYSDYDFSSDIYRPWSRVNDFRVSVPVRWALSREMQVFATPSLRFDWEDGSEMSEGATAGAILGVGWQVSETLFIGPGAGVFSGLEESVDAFPILLLDWDITESLALRTGSGLGASRGPGLTLEWQAAEDWSFGIGARYEKVRFRLDDNGIAPGGVGEDRALPVFLTASWAPSPAVNLTAIAGWETEGQLALEDASGTIVDETDYDTGVFAGFAFSVRF